MPRINFYSGISNALRIQGGANIYNSLKILATRLKHLKRVLNIRNVFETKHVANIQNALLMFQTRQNAL